MGLKFLSFFERTTGPHGDPTWSTSLYHLIEKWRKKPCSSDITQIRYVIWLIRRMYILLPMTTGFCKVWRSTYTEDRGSLARAQTNVQAKGALTAIWARIRRVKLPGKVWVCERRVEGPIEGSLGQ